MQAMYELCQEKRRLNEDSVSVVLRAKPKDVPSTFRGESDLPRLVGQADVRVELAWDPEENADAPKVDFDIIAVFVGKDGRAIEAIYYHPDYLLSSCCSVRLRGDCPDGEPELVDEQLDLCRDGLIERSDVEAVIIYAVLHDAASRGQSLERTKRSRVCITDSHGNTLLGGHVSLNAEKFAGQDAVRLCELARSRKFMPDIEPVGGKFADFMHEVGVELPAAA